MPPRFSRDLPDHASAIKRELVDARAVCEGLGLLDGRGSFQRQATGLTVRCPKHGGVSCSVTRGPDGTVRVRCFGCDFSGDVLHLIAAARGFDIERDFRAVLLEGARLAGLWSVVNDLEQRQVPLREGRGRAPNPPPPKPTPPPDPKPLDADTFDRLATALLEACPLDAQADVCTYLDERKMLDIARAAGWGALPEVAGQGPVLERLVEMFGAEVLEESGLARRRGDRLAFVWDGNRLVIPWRAPGVSGAVQTLQRRLVRPPKEREQKYVFPRSRRPVHPYIEACDFEDMSENAAIAIVEGAVDAVALRWLARGEGRDVVVMGIPGVKNWRSDWAAYGKGRTVYLALDADRAGNDAVEAIRRDLWEAAAIKRWRPKTGKDWADHLADVRTAA
jgi:DNA primase